MARTLRWITLLALALFVLEANFTSPALAQATPCTLNPNGSTLVITCFGMPQPAPSPTTLPTMQPGVANRNFNQSFTGNNGSNGGSSLSPGCFTPCGGSPGQPGLSVTNYVTQAPSGGYPACVFNPFCFAAGTMLYATASGAPAAILLQSIGGSGGRGGNGAVGVSGAPGGQGGAGGAISGTIGANGNLQLLTTTANTPGLWVRSAGGTGGNGGSGFLSNGASGAPGGSGGAISINVGANIYTFGTDGYGILAQSLGGNGGSGGSTWAGIGSGGNGAGGQSGGNVAVTLTSGGSIFTVGNDASGILAQSVGGFGGTGGGGGGLLTFGGTGSTGGFGGTINLITQTGTSITTVGLDADGILAESVGGGGGAGGSGGGVFTIGGGGGAGGLGSAVSVNSSSNINTYGALAKGIFAQSVGGGGGDGGAASGIFNLGGSASAASNGGTVQAYNTGNITTYATGNGIGDASSLGSAAIFAQSVGGRGGNGGVTNGWVSVGGSGGGGGNGGIVLAANSGNLTTFANYSQGVLAQSIGGGGGNGGGAGGYGLGGSLAIGGSGGNGGFGSTVQFDNTGGAIRTSGAFSEGIELQSVGGGGGNGGDAISVAVASGFAVAVGLGGSGGGGGYGGNVSGTFAGSITTSGVESDGILAQSVGGGGGSGGLAVTAAAGASYGSLGVSLGGSGGSGGNALGTVLVLSRANVTTSGDDSVGILAQSVGGGGGSGGTAISAAAGKVASLALALGARGGSGGYGNNVQLNSNGTITTSGANAVGLLAQSLGGGGGNGGNSIAASLGTIAGGFSLGGIAGAGQDAGTVLLNNGGSISTSGADAVGILAQSMGGGGGNGGYSVSGSIGGGTANISIGGNGATGGNADDVTLNNAEFTNTTITTRGANADGIVAQSIGGSGGNGGWSVSGGASAFFSAGASVGGSAGNAGLGSTVELNSGGNLGGGNSAIATINTSGANANGIVAQSIGGGGGNGGWSVSGTLSANASVGVGVGGAGGAGSTSDAVTVVSFSNIATQGANASDIIAQSIAGGGGNGGFSVTGAGGVNFGGSVNVGGAGSSGGTSSLVNLTSIGTLSTQGANADAILAQSIGGGGGNGGFSVAGSLSNGPTGTISVGGAGGNGAESDNVVVTQTGNITTQGNESSGIVAQSIGGGGGNGGWSVGGGIAGSAPALNVSVGGFGGTGANAGTAVVFFNSGGTITTQGANAGGIIAESLGGGGGNGGWSVSGQIANGGNLGLNIGGFGGSAGAGAGVSIVTGTTTIITNGAESAGIDAESIGGGGGNGGFSVVGSLTAASTLNLGIGGYGASGGSGALTTVTSSSNIQTSGNESPGIEAQSIGGGGGNGGFSVSGSVSQNYSGSVAIGGEGSGGGTGDRVQLTSSGQMIMTDGDDSDGILAQSIGGGGGKGGFAVSGQANFSAGGTATGLNLSIGGAGGTGGNSGLVIALNGATIVTKGDNSNGMLVQSIGGGGGSGGFAVNATFAQGQVANIALGGAGLSGGASGNAALVDTASVETFGDSSNGLVAQSLGGGGGSGGFAVAASFATVPPGGTQTSTSFTGSFGGNGGAGSAAGTVRLTAGSATASPFDVITNGENSDGLLAESIGGGGGSGGFAVTFQAQAGATPPNSSPLASFTLAMGGNGGQGGTANTVTVNNFDNIETLGNNSAAIDAQSLGGGGGSGGFSVNGSINTTGNQVALSFGGSGGLGNTGNNVTVNSGTSNSTVTIDTSGNNSDGILAQSIGGGGGAGGFSVGVAASKSSSILSLAPGKGLSLGSAGGSGNNAGTVTVSSFSTITTMGNQSLGIKAQSIGGGGGSGAFTFSGSVTPKSGSGSFAYGSGGGAGTANVVMVTNNGTISTQGEQSDGILAESIGGGGGFGGSTWTTTFANQAGVSSIPLGVTDIDMGSTAGGGSGNSVTVTNSGSITTKGSQSSAIEAQSIGGAGGEGGMSISGGIDVSGDKAAAPGFAFGASGGAGGGGGSVTVTSTANLLMTSGVEADGIFAQSLGGGGGKGGLAVTGSLTGSPTGNIAMGGFGGGGGGAQGVIVTTTGNGQIITQGDLSLGIEAESIGGGGGSGGNAITGQGASKFSANVALGASGGSGGAPGNVTITSAAAIETQGDVADGILAQSVGGGGGNAGYAVVGSLNQYGTANVAYGMSGGAGGSGNAITITQSGDVLTQGAVSNGIVAQSIGAGGGNGGFTVGGGISGGGLSLALGASGGAGGSGAAVSVTASAPLIETEGNMSNAIIAQSIGGGGGNQGWNVAGQVSLLPIFIGAGATNGAGGNGGTVTVNNNGGILTAGQLSNGIVAQSIGGGGGYITALQTTNVTLGADKVTSGGGTAVTVMNNAGATIETTGDSSFGIFAQSVGGGGGAIFAPSTVTMQGATGNGSIVQITDAGGIFTSGVGSDGIFAQSVGGGGGYAGASGTFVAGSGGGSGTASLVNVSVSGEVATTGVNAVGVYAQSAAGSGAAGGNVNVNVGGTVSALNASGIVETSTGGAGGGTDNVTVRPTGTVESGVTSTDTSAPASAPSAAAINFVAGANATLLNNGTVAAPNGYAVVSNLAATSITNNGTLVGSVWLAPGANTFTNTGTFEAGSVVNLGGAGNTLTNSGTLAIGFLNNGGETTITGNLTQGPSGTLLEAVNIGAPDPPELFVTGNAALQGTLAIASIGLGSAQPGTHTFTLIDAGGTLSDSMTLSTAPSAIVQYTLLGNAPGGGVMIQSHVDFDPAGLTPEGLEFGSYLNAVQMAGSSPSLQGMVAQAISSAGTPQLERIYDEVTPESFGAVEAATLTNALSFSQQMTACRASEASFASTAGDRCIWGTIGNTSTSQMESGAILGYNESATGVNLGTERAVSRDKRTFFGAGLNFSNDNLYVNSTTLTGWRYMAGAFVKREADTGFEYSAQLTGGVASYQSNRWIVFPSESISDADGATGYGTIATPAVQALATDHVSFLNAGLRSEKLLHLRDGWTLTPYLALNDTLLYMSPFSESGAGGLSITTQGTSNSFLTLQPGLQFSGAIGTIVDEHLRLHLDLFATQLLGNNQTSLSAMLQGEPAALGMTQFNSAIDRTLWNIAPTIDVSGKHGLDFRLGGSYLFSSHLHSGTINVNVSQKVGKPPGEF